MTDYIRLLLENEQIFIDILLIIVTVGCFVNGYQNNIELIISGVLGAYTLSPRVKRKE